jgi:dsRNA-specific ribonuclease
MCKEVAIEDLKKNYPKKEEVELSNRRNMYILR